MHWACKRNFFEGVKLLLNHHADANHADYGGRTPIYYAVREKNTEIIKLLLLHQASPWSTDSYNLNTMIGDDWTIYKLIKNMNKITLTTKNLTFVQR